MPQFGYSLSSEEFAPNDLVKFAQRAERTGLFRRVDGECH